MNDRAVSSLRWKVSSAPSSMKRTDRKSGRTPSHSGPKGSSSFPGVFPVLTHPHSSQSATRCGAWLSTYPKCGDEPVEPVTRPARRFRKLELTLHVHVWRGRPGGQAAQQVLPQV